MNQFISFSADGEDVEAGRAEEGSEMVDEHAKGTGGEGIVLFPQGGEDGMPVHYLILSSAEHKQQVGLSTGEVLPVKSLMHGVKGMAVEDKSLLLIGFIMAHASKDGFNTADEYIHGEGFGLIVIASELESTHLIFSVVAAGEDYDRQPGVPMAYLAQQLVAVQAERLELHEDDIVMGVGEHVKGLASFGDVGGLIAAGTEIVAQDNGKTDVTIDDQNAGIHGFGYFKRLQRYAKFLNYTSIY